MTATFNEFIQEVERLAEAAGYQVDVSDSQRISIDKIGPNPMPEFDIERNTTDEGIEYTATLKFPDLSPENCPFKDSILFWLQEWESAAKLFMYINSTTVSYEVDSGTNSGNKTYTMVYDYMDAHPDMFRYADVDTAKAQVTQKLFGRWLSIPWPIQRAVRQAVEDYLG